MPKIKTCRSCGAVLVCEQCGTRCTPDLKRQKGRTFATRLDENTETQIDSMMNSSGKSRSKVIRDLLVRALNKREKKKTKVVK